MAPLEIASGRLLELLERSVEPEWVSALGHMRAAQYVALFDDAIMVMLPGLGITDRVLRAGATSPFLSDLHATYLREVKGGERVHITGQLLEWDGRRVRIMLAMDVAGAPAATCELLIVNMDLAARRPAAWSAAQAAAWTALAAAHAALPRPATAGRAVASLASSAGRGQPA